MALSLEAANKVRLKTRAITLNPGIFYGLKAFFLHWAANKGNLDLQFVPVDGTYSSSDGGNNASQVLADAACQLYVLYLKKFGATAVSFKASNSATTAATDGTQQLGEIVTTASEYVLHVYPDGLAYSSGLTVTENTTATGSTLTLAANRLDGFVIIGA